MNFFEAMELVTLGKAVRRKSWIGEAGILMGVSEWYVFLNGNTLCLFSFDHTFWSEMKLTVENIQSKDWEVCPNMYEIELAALKRKHGVA